MGISQGIQERFSFKTFVVGMLGVVAVYGSLFLYLFLVQDQTMADLESRLTSQTVLIDRPQAEIPQVEAQMEDAAQEAVQIEDSPGELTEETAQPTNTEENDDITLEDLEDLVDRQAKALRASPVDGFFTETEYGRLPIARSPEQTPFIVYQRPFVLNRSKPFIGVVVQNFGLSKELSETMIAELPASVSFILSPYSADPEEWAQKARNDGHEIWLHMPVENNNFPMDDPGAKGLLTRVSLQYNQERLQWILGRATGYAGIAVFSDNALKNSGAMFTNMARETLGRGLGLLELNTGQGSFFVSVAEESEAPYTQTTHVIDIIDSNSAALQSVQTSIDTTGGAVVMVNPSPKNLPALKSWLAELERSGIIPTPVSAIADPSIERN